MALNSEYTIYLLKSILLLESLNIYYSIKGFILFQVVLWASLLDSKVVWYEKKKNCIFEVKYLKY